MTGSLPLATVYGLEAVLCGATPNVPSPTKHVPAWLAHLAQPLAHRLHDMRTAHLRLHSHVADRDYAAVVAGPVGAGCRAALLRAGADPGWRGQLQAVLALGGPDALWAYVTGGQP